MGGREGEEEGGVSVEMFDGQRHDVDLMRQETSDCANSRGR